ncbi:GntR family transcriptional regulator [Streptomyces avidinii]
MSSEAAYAGRGVHKTAVEGLARRIFDGTYDEGATLDLPHLLEELEVSQTVLREAIKVLMAKGLLDARQKRGTFVRPLADWNLFDADVLRWKLAAGAPACFFSDLLALRRAIEPAAAALAAERATARDLAALDAALAGLMGAGERLERADASFHLALLTASHNLFFTQMYRVIIPALAERDLDRTVHEKGDCEHPHAVHRARAVAVVDRIRHGDPDGAYRAVLALLDT